MKLSQLIVTVGIAVASVAAFGGLAVAAPTAGSTAVACVNGDGVTCDTLVCASGVLTVVTDDSGVQHQACVESAAAEPVAPLAAPAKASLVPQPTPTTGPATLPTTGTGTDGLVIAAILVVSGSIASLLSRRKP